LGEGSYGTVWKAVWHGVGGGTVIAVKKLHLTALSGDEIVIFDSSHILPRYILKYSINTKKKKFCIPFINILKNSSKN
jgi:hypothetical protein